MNQPPIGHWVTDAYDSLHLHSCTHVHNMNLTDTINTNCHRSYSSYCNEYLFDTATSKQRVYMHKLSSNWAHPHQIAKSPKDKSHSCQLAIYLHNNLQSTCSFVTQFCLQSTCTTICNPLVHLWLNSACNHLAHNLQSSCSFVTQFYLQSTCTQFAINLLFVTQLYLRSTRLQFTIKLALSKFTSTGIAITHNLQSNWLLAKLLQMAFKLPVICNQLQTCS